MGFAEDKVKDYILKNLPRFQVLRVNQLMDYLPCLTNADRQEIRAHKDMRGDCDSTYELFSRLWCRKGWVTDLIRALEANNSDLAEDVRQVYESNQVPTGKSPSAASTIGYRAQALGSVPVSPGVTFSDDCPRSPPRSQSRPARVQLPVSTNTSASAPSASPQDVVDCRSPVQETKFPSWSSKAVGDTEVLEEDRKLSNSTPNPQSRNAAESSAGLGKQHEKLTAAQGASPGSLTQHQIHLREAPKEEMQCANTASSRPSAGNLGQNWDSFQRHPVCVQNGYFGNMHQSVDSGTSPAATGPKDAASTDLTASINQPEENSYLSSDSSPLPPRRQDVVQAEEQNRQALWGYQQVSLLGDLPNNKPVLQMQVGEEHKGAPGQQDNRIQTNTVLLLQKEGVGRLPEGSLAASKGNTVDLEIRETAAVALPPPTAPLLGQSPSKGDQLPQRSTKKEQDSRIANTAPVRFRSPPSDFTGSSSIDVIPPSSPAADSDTLSDGFSVNLKHPVQEIMLEGTDLWTPSELAQEKVIGNTSPEAAMSWPSYGTDTPTNSREDRNNASFRDGCVFCSNPEEEDVELVKPGFLVSGEIPRRPLSQHLSNPGREYSGTSDRFRFSDSVGSDHLMLSDSTQHSRSEEVCLDPVAGARSGRNVTVENSNASLDHHSEDSSIRTHMVHVEESPSVDLAAAPNMTSPALGNASESPGDFSVAKSQPIKNVSSPTVSNSGQINFLQSSIGDAAPLLMSDSAMIAVGFGLMSLVAFGLYKKLKK